MTGGARCSWARRAKPEIPGGKFFFADVPPGISARTTVKTCLLQLDNHDIPQSVDYTIIELLEPVSGLANFQGAATG